VEVGRILRATKEANLTARASEVQSATDISGSGPLTTIEPMAIQAAYIATQPNLAKDRRASG
jgi:hypothetical protein